MKHPFNRYSHNVALLATLAFGMTLVACDNSVQIGPTEPMSPYIPQNAGELRTLAIDGSFASDSSSCLKATILFDGEEIAGARASCQSAQGCAELQLSGTVSAPAGHHIITFQVLRQSVEIDGYRAEGFVRVSRPDIILWGPVTLELPPKRATLRRGEGVEFSLDILD